MVDKASIIKEAQKYLAKGQIDKAVAEWEKLVKESPDGATYNTIGDLYLKKGDRQHSIEAYHKASRIFRDEGFSLKALALYKKILNINPSDGDALFALGELNEEKNIAMDAIKYYLAAADTFSKENKKDKLLATYDRILNLAPTNIPLRVKISELFSKEGFAVEAAREFIAIGAIYLEQGDLENANKYTSKALEIQPGSRDGLLSMSRINEKRGNFPEAVRWLKKVTDSEGESKELLLFMGRLLTASGSHEEAIGYISKAVLADPSDFDSKRMLGDAYMKLGEQEKAWQEYSAVLDEMIFKGNFNDAIAVLNSFKDAEPVETRRKLIALYNQTGDEDSAVAELSALAVVYEGGGQPVEALKCYQEALALRPEDAVIKENISNLQAELGMEHVEEEKPPDEMLTEADIFLRYGLYDEAKGLLESLKVKLPENMDLHLKLKSLYLDTGDKEQAVTECLILAELYGRQGRDEERQTALSEAAEINPDDPRLAGRAAGGEAGGTAPYEAGSPAPSIEDYTEEISEAEFYARQGLIPEALDIYRRLYSMFPDDEELRDKLSELQGTTGETEAPTESIEPPAAFGEGFSSGMAEEGREEEAGEETISLEGLGALSEGFMAGIEPVEAQEMKEPELESDVLEIFEEFKRGLAKDLEAEDYETHYNLGIAYKEMGLTDDSINEFQAAKKDPKFFVQATTMLGMCYTQKGLYQLAIDAFSSALMKIEARDESYWGTKYDLAEAYERNGDLAEALRLYTEVFGWNAKFREVADKVNSLRAARPASTAGPATGSPVSPATGPSESPDKTSEVSDKIKKKSRVSYI